MPDVFDKDGKIVKSADDVVLNDLTQAPVLDHMPVGTSWCWRQANRQSNRQVIHVGKII